MSFVMVHPAAKADTPWRFPKELNLPFDVELEFAGINFRKNQLNRVSAWGGSWIVNRECALAKKLAEEREPEKFEADITHLAGTALGLAARQCGTSFFDAPTTALQRRTHLRKKFDLPDHIPAGRLVDESFKSGLFVVKSTIQQDPQLNGTFPQTASYIAEGWTAEKIADHTEASRAGMCRTIAKMCDIIFIEDEPGLVSYAYLTNSLQVTNP